VLRPGFEPSETLKRELLAFARTRLGAVVAPKEIEFVASVPRTRSGKPLLVRRIGPTQLTVSKKIDYYSHRAIPNAEISRHDAY